MIFLVLLYRGNWLIKKKNKFCKNINRAYVIDNMKQRYSKWVLLDTEKCVLPQIGW